MTTVLDNTTSANAPSGARRGVDVTIDGVTVTYGSTDAVVDATLDIEAGSIVALLGPSGCGKTSLLRAIAGLERPTSGRISIGDTVVSSSADRTWIKPERRHVGMVFQDGALFPHLTVAENIAFGLSSRNGEAAKRVDELLDLVDLGGLGDRLPETLSGGQQQRVALARSLAPNPKVLLLDEPFSALDASLRSQVRSDVAHILRDIGVTSIFVTHDQDEAFVLGDRVAVMRDARLEQVGAPKELYRSPASAWIATFVGEANLLSGARAGDAVETVLGRVPVADPSQLEGADDATVLVRPEQIQLIDGGHATVTAVEYYGHDVRYDLRLADGSPLIVRTLPDVVFEVDDSVDVTYAGTPTEAWPS